MSNNDVLTKHEFNSFMSSFLDDFTSEFNQALKYIYQRFDEIDKRFEKLESTIHSVKNDTRIIHPMFELVRMDTTDIGKLKLRVDNLENNPKRTQETDQ